MTGDELRAIRQSMHLSRTALAEQMGVHWNTINKWRSFFVDKGSSG
jgi:DNA-binding transcriptional regulator YiaG